MPLPESQGIVGLPSFWINLLLHGISHIWNHTICKTLSILLTQSGVFQISHAVIDFNTYMIKKLII